MRAFGLQSHIWSNNLRSILLMAGFPLLLMLLFYALALLVGGMGAEDGSVDIGGNAFVWAARAVGDYWPFAFVASAAWFSIAYLGHQAMIDAAARARPLSRDEDPRVYNLLENLCISRGLKTPALRIIETDALNAYASGVHQGNYSITVTRGLRDTLNDAELEAVLAHELTHIRNGDVRLMIVAVIFVGVFSFFGEMVFRALSQGNWSSGGGSGGRGSSRSRDSDSGGGGAAVIAAVVIIAIAYALAIAIRFALSRRREYLADAGAVELTKQPDAMISALRKIAGHADLPGAPSELREMMIENRHAAIGDVFATHPPIEKRIEALVAYAGGVDSAGAARASG